VDLAVGEEARAAGILVASHAKESGLVEAVAGSGGRHRDDSRRPHAARLHPPPFPVHRAGVMEHGTTRKETLLPLFACEGKSTRVHPTAFIAPTAVLIGELTVEENASVWYN